MSWEPSPYAAQILRRREEKLESALEEHLSRRRILLRSTPTSKQKQQLAKVEESILWTERALLEVWDPPHLGTMAWEDALQAIWAAGRRHHDGRNQLLVSLHPQTLKTARRRGVDLRALCILEWQESREVDEAVLTSSDGEQLQHLVIPSKNLELGPASLEVYHQLRLDGMGVKAAAEVARIVTTRVGEEKQQA